MENTDEMDKYMVYGEKTIEVKTCAEGLRFLAVWLDCKFGDAGSGNDGVQQDLRKWAEEHEALKKENEELKEWLHSCYCEYTRLHKKWVGGFDK